MSGMILPKPEQLLDLVGHAVVINATMHGEFDKDIAAFKEATSALAEQNGIVKTLEQAERIRAAATADAEATRIRCEEAIAKANVTLGTALDRERAVTDRETAVGRRESNVTQAAELLKKREDEFNANALSATEKLSAREVKLAENERNYAVAASKLAKDIEAFNARLDSLRA